MIDRQRLGEPSRSSCQVAEPLDTAIEPHDRSAFERLELSTRHARSDLRGLARDIQHVEMR